MENVSFLHKCQVRLESLRSFFQVKRSISRHAGHKAGSGIRCFLPPIIGLTLSKNRRSRSVISNCDLHWVQFSIVWR